MKKLNRLKKIKLNFNTLTLLLLSTLVLMTIIIISLYIKSQIPAVDIEDEIYLNQNSDSDKVANIDEFKGASKLLQVLPYGTSDFTVNYLSLEKDVKPVITVTYLTDLGEAKFNEWIETIVFDPMSVEFNYLPIPVYEIFQ